MLLLPEVNQAASPRCSAQSTKAQQGFLSTWSTGKAKKKRPCPAKELHRGSASSYATTRALNENLNFEGLRPNA